MLFLFLLAPLCLFADSFILDKHGLGLEAMIGGVGTARLGSSGAVNSNPALLSWLPKQKRFISSNQIRKYNIHSEGQDSYEFKLDIVPLYQATTEGLGDWGYGYGLNIDINKIDFASGLGTTRNEAYIEQQRINLLAGAGKRWGHHAFGLSAYIGRFTAESDVHFQGSESGFDFLGTVKTSSVAWSTGLVAGWAGSWENFVIGAATKFNVAKFGAQSNQRATIFTETTGQTTVQKTRDVDHLKIVPTHSLGLMSKLGPTRIFLDWFYSPSHRDNELGGRQSSSQEFLLGLDSPLKSGKYKWYAGAGFSPSSALSNDKDTPEKGSVSFGYQKKSAHSLSFGGLGWTQALADAPDSILLVTFGTQFDY